MLDVHELSRQDWQSLVMLEGFRLFAHSDFVGFLGAQFSDHNHFVEAVRGFAISVALGSAYDHISSTGAEEHMGRATTVHHRVKQKQAACVKLFTLQQGVRKTIKWIEGASLVLL